MRRAAVFALAVVMAASTPSGSFADVEIIGGNPLYDPLIAGDTVKVERILATGAAYADTSLDNTRKTALMLVSSAGNEEMVALLLKYKAKTDLRDQIGNTALAYAALRGHVEVAELLVAAGAAVDIDNRQGMTPLMIAAQQGQAEFVRFLIKKGADAKRVDYTGRTALAWAEYNRRSAAVAALKQAGVKE
jgi:ankyrin repeat protein